MNPQQQHFATYNPQQQQFLARTQSGQFATHAAGANAGVGVGAPGPALHAWAPHFPQEQQYYDLLFAHADDQRCGTIGGRQAVAFFSRSHLDKAVLREVWSIADSQQKGVLSRNEFYVAMRLISMAQRGEQISTQRFVEMATMPFPLPVLEGVPPPPPMHPSGGVGLPQQSIPAPVQAHSGMGSGLHAVQPNGAAYALNAEEKSRYDAVFQQYDTDQDGFLLGGEAVALFEMSGLDRNVLRSIWAMADVTQDSKLSLQEFYVAMHLIVCVSKRGLPLPPTLPRELADSVFGGVNSGMSGFRMGPPAHQRTASRDSSMHGSDSLSASRDGSFVHVGGSQKGAASLPAPEPEGMSAFDSLATVEDAPLPSLDSTSQSSRESSFNHAPSSSEAEHVPSATDRFAGAVAAFGSSTPSGSLHNGLPAPGQPEYSALSTSRTPSVTSGTERERTNSASSLNSMSSFSGMAPLHPQQQQQPRSLGSHERLQLPRAETASYHMAPPQAPAGMVGPGAAGFAPMPQVTVAAAPEEKPFLSDPDEQKAVRELDQRNDEVVDALASVERQQTAIETLTEKLRELDELRHQLISLAMERESMRAATAADSRADEDPAAVQTRRLVERSLRELVANEQQQVQQLQRDVAHFENELEEATLSAKFAQQASLDVSPAHPSSTAATTAAKSDPLVSMGGGGFDTFNDFSSPQTSADPTMPSTSIDVAAPANSPFSPLPSPSQSQSQATTDNSGFNALSNFDPAPLSTGSMAASPSPVGVGTTATEGSLLSPSPSPSPSPSAAGDDGFEGFGDFDQAATPPSSRMENAATETAGASPSPAAASNDSFDSFGDFNAPAPVSGAGTDSSAMGSSLFSPSPSPAGANRSAFNTGDDYSAVSFDADSTDPSPCPETSAATSQNSAPSVSPAEISNDGFDAFGDFGAAAPVSSPPSRASSFATVPLSSNGDASVPSPVTRRASSPAATNGPHSRPAAPSFDAFGDFGAAAPASSPPSKTNSFVDAPLSFDGDAPTPSSTSGAAVASGNSVFSPTPSPAAASNDGFDAFGDFGAAAPVSSPPSRASSFATVPLSSNGDASVPSSVTRSASSPAATNGFDAFGDFNAAPASSPPSKTNSFVGAPADSSTASKSNDSFDAFGDFTAPSSSPPSTTTSFVDVPLSTDQAADSSAPSFTANSNEGFAAFGDFSAAPSTETGVATDTNGFAAFGDFSAAGPAPTPTPAAAEKGAASSKLPESSPFSPSPTVTATATATAASSTKGEDEFTGFGDFTGAASSATTSGSFDAFSDQNFN